MEYLDFELDVQPGSAGGYDVTLDSPAGQARNAMQLPYDGLELRSRIQALHIALLRSGTKRRAGTAEDRAVAEFGRDMFRSLFSGEIQRRFAVSRSIAGQQGKGVRIKLRISAPELLGLPWEYLYDEGEDAYLALGIGTPIVRYVPLAQSVQPLEVSPPIRVLAMVAAPNDLGEIDVANERQRLERSLSSLRERGLLELKWVSGQSWEHLQRELWEGPWHVFHFIGHGGFSPRRGTGLIYLTGDDGNSREFSAADVGVLLGDHDALRLAVLNSCDTAQGSETDVFSSTAATLVRRGTPAVVAMQFQITDDAALQFSRVFYEAVAHGMPVDAAVTEARKSILLRVQNTYEWGTPVLFMRSPDGVLFRVPAEVKREAPVVQPAPPTPDTALPSAGPGVEREAPAAEPRPRTVGPTPTVEPPRSVEPQRTVESPRTEPPRPVEPSRPLEPPRTVAPPAPRPAQPTPPPYSPADWQPAREQPRPVVARYPAQQPAPGPAWVPDPRTAYAPPFYQPQRKKRSPLARAAGFLIAAAVTLAVVGVGVLLVQRLLADAGTVVPDVPDVPGFAGEVEIVLSPDSGPVGSEVTVSGTGFGGDETVVVRFHTVEVGDTSTDSDGNFQMAVTVPEEFGFFPGTHFDIVAQGQSTLKFDSAQFLVTE